MFAWMLCLLISIHAHAEVMAVDAKSAEPIEAETVTSVSEGKTIIDKKNIRYEFSAHSVFDFQSDGSLRLLRGSVVASSPLEKTLLTTSAKIDFIGRLVVSYDHKEKSTSAFVLEGQARMVNPHESDRTLLLDRFRGASMEAGAVFPQLIRQLDFASVDEWLKGYAWEKEKRQELLHDLPQKVAVTEEVPEHLKETKLDDYFSAVEAPLEDRGQPEYYEKKFGDQDRAVLEANQKKSIKVTSPEQAALINLPTNKIDLALDLPVEFLNEEAKAKEIEQAMAQKPSRKIASVSKPTVEKRKEVVRPSAGDPEVNAVLDRLRSIRTKANIVSQKTESTSRSPASISPSTVPDPVYDYSQNF